MAILTAEPLSATHRWAVMAGQDLLPAVPQLGGARVEALQHLDWLGDTPTVHASDGKVRRILGWTEMWPSGFEVAGWVQCGYNLLLQHRTIKGLRISGDHLRRNHLIRRAHEILDCDAFPIVREPGAGGPYTLFFRVQIGYLQSQVNPTKDVSFLSHDSLTLVAGCDQEGKRAMTLGNPVFITPPIVELPMLEQFWREEAGGVQRLLDSEKSVAAYIALYSNAADSLARFLIDNGWAVGFDQWGMDCRCPFHHDSIHNARFLPPAPRWKNAMPSFRCPHSECRKRAPSEFFRAMGYAGPLLLRRS